MTLLNSKVVPCFRSLLDWKSTKKKGSYSKSLKPEILKSIYEETNLNHYDYETEIALV